MKLGSVISLLIAIGSGFIEATKPEGSRYQGALPCEDIQRCLNRESRECWKKFYNEAKKKEDLVGDVLKACPENEFMDVVDRTEAELWPEFNQVDKNLTECMTDTGFKVNEDFCGNMRSVNYSRLMEKTIDHTKKEARMDPKHSKREANHGGEHVEHAEHKHKDGKSPNEGDKCWINVLRTCVNQYPPPTEKINEAISNCEEIKKTAEDEERLGFEVGKRVILKIVTKLKEAFDKEDLGEDDEDPKDVLSKLNGTLSNHTVKAVAKSRPK